MGGSTFQIIGAAADVIGAADKAQSQSQAEQAQEDAINLRMSQQRMAADEESIQRSDKITQVLSAQKAREATSGLSLASPTFLALSDQSYNAYAQDQGIARLNEQGDILQDKLAIGAAKMNLTTEQTADTIGAVKDVANLFAPGAPKSTADASGAQSSSLMSQQGSPQVNNWNKTFQKKYEGTSLDFYRSWNASSNGMGY